MRRGPPPSPRSRRRRPRSAAVPRRLRRGLDAGEGASRSPAAFAVVSTPAALPPSPWSRRRRPKTASLAGLPRRGLDAGGRDAPLRRDGPPPSPRSWLQRPKIASFARLPCRGLEAGGQRLPAPPPPRWPAVSTPAAADRRGVPPPSQPAYFFNEVLRSNFLDPSPLMSSTVGGPRVLEQLHWWFGEFALDGCN